MYRGGEYLTLLYLNDGLYETCSYNPLFKNKLKSAKTQNSEGDFLYFTKLSTDYVHSTKRAKNLVMALEYRVYRELICKSATLGTLWAPSAALLLTCSI